ncbi:MAG: Holliday junction branch migration protein RuvA [Bdellovibrionales bacterium]|nr:Holliday junction branch migration protein RuvA [Bdellovibrionales bacterium]
MIGFIRGKILENAEGRLLIGVGAGASQSDPSGGMVGYDVSVPSSANYALLATGTLTDLFIHTHVREDVFSLFGFTSSTEKELFMTLISVNGIGPKGALGILSAMESSDLVSCILSGDKDRLVKVPGIGKKTAERMVLELTDPIQKKVDAGIFSTGTVSPGARGSALQKSAAKIARNWPKPAIEARDALVGLGYKDLEIEKWLQEFMEEDGFHEAMKTEDVIRQALRKYGKSI